MWTPRRIASSLFIWGGGDGGDGTKARVRYTGMRCPNREGRSDKPGWEKEFQGEGFTLDKIFRRGWREGGGKVGLGKPFPSPPTVYRREGAPKEGTRGRPCAARDRGRTPVVRGPGMGGRASGSSSSEGPWCPPMMGVMKRDCLRACLETWPKSARKGDKMKSKDDMEKRDQSRDACQNQDPF